MDWSVIIPEFVSGMIGVFLGVWFQNSHSLKMQKKFTFIQFRINKLAEVATILSDYIRDIVSFNVQSTRLARGQISLEMYKQLSDEHQEKIIKSYRMLLVNRRFLEKTHQVEFEVIHNAFNNIAEKSYEAYYNTNAIQRIYTDEEISDEVIKLETYTLAEKATSLLDSLNKEISDNMTKLNK